MKLVVRSSALIALSALCAASALAQQPAVIAQRPPSGANLFLERCVVCHGAPADSRTPSREILRQFTPERILAAITTGPMTIQAEGLTEQEKQSLAVFLAGRPIGAARSGEASAMKNRCSAQASVGDIQRGPSWRGWSTDLENTRFQPAASAGLDLNSVPKLKLKWAFGLPSVGNGVYQPAVVNGHVFVASDSGYLYSLDAATGCVYWSFEAQASVHTAVSVGQLKSATGIRNVVYFGDTKANIYSVDADSGKQIWVKRVETHPMAKITGGIAVQGNRLYAPVSAAEEGVGSNVKYECCTFRGSVVALDAGDGHQIWKSFTIFEPPMEMRKNSIGTQLWKNSGAAVWDTPTLDLQRRAVYVGTGEAYSGTAADTTDAVVAFDMDTGKTLWWRQLVSNDSWIGRCLPLDKERTENCPAPDQQNISANYVDADVGTSPILKTLPDKRRVLIVAGESGAVYALDPDRRGAVVWHTHLGEPPEPFVGDLFGGHGGVAFGSAADDRAVYLPLERTAGGLVAISLLTGERLWYMPSPKPHCDENAPRSASGSGCSASQHAAVTLIPGVVFSGVADGMLRAHATGNGLVIWEFNTNHEFETVNGVQAKGGQIRGHGPTVAGGMLFVPTRPGNVLLALAVE